MFKSNLMMCLVASCLMFIVCLRVLAADMGNDQVIKMDNIEGIICTNYSDWQFLFREPCKFWKPNKKAVLAGEAAINLYLSQLRPANSPDLAKKLSQYRRQYLGITVEGKKRIHYNFFPKSMPLTDKVVSVFDGGDSYFQIEYELQNGKCYSQIINGEA